MFLHDSRLCGQEYPLFSLEMSVPFSTSPVSSGTFSHGHSYSPKFLVFSHRLFNFFFHLKKLSYDSITPFFFLFIQTCHRNSLGIRTKSLQSCPSLCDPVDYSRQASVPMGFSRQEYWSGQPCLLPGHLSASGRKPMSPVLAGQVFTTSITWEAQEQSIPNYISLLSFISSLYSTSSYQVFLITSN